MKIKYPRKRVEIKGEKMSTAFGKIGADRQLQDHWIRRLIAAIIDGAIMWIVSWIISWILLFPLILSGTIFFTGFAFPFLSGILWMFYAAFTESGLGTIGKQVVHLKVTTMDGKTPSLDRTFIRNISKLHPLFWLLDVVVGMATPGDPYQKYSDRFAGTTVVSATATLA